MKIVVSSEGRYQSIRIIDGTLIFVILFVSRSF